MTTTQDATALDAAEELAARLRADAAERDRANQPPWREIEALRASGLLALHPDDHRTGHAVTRIISAADPSIGHLFGYHYLHLWRFGLFERPERVAELWRDTARNQWFWAGVSNPGDVVQAAPACGGLVLNGTRAFATGALVADRLIVNATRADTGERLTIAVDAATPGISHPRDWDNIGQRLSASGSVVFEDVAVAMDDVVGALPPAKDDPRMIRLSLSSLSYQSILTQVLVGIAEGALTEAAGYTRAHTRPWALSGVDTATEDPYILAGYGELLSAVQAVGLLADRAAAAFEEVAGRGRALTAEERGTAGVTISAAKVLATRVVTDTTTRIFELIGARGTAARFGFDRFWRNARTLTLHDPVAYKAREIGAHFLTGELPPFTAYS